MLANTSYVYDTRETWLNAFINRARFAFVAVGAPIPLNTRVAIGFTSKGNRGKAIGECWSSKCSADNTFEIFIKSTQDDPYRVCDILTHELVHAAVGLEAKHGPLFKLVAEGLGLGGKMTATVATEAWHAWADPIVADLGPLPHAALRSDGVSSGRPKQKTYMAKLICPCCGWTARTTLKHIDPYSVLQCPTACGGELVAE